MMRLLIAAVAILAGSCGAVERREPPAHPPAEVITPPSSVITAPETVSCGQLTCGPAEYCLIKCLCCGVRIADPSEARASYECVPIPPECRADACGCDSRPYGLCNPKNRTVETPCA